MCQNVLITKWLKMWGLQAEDTGAALDMLPWASYLASMYFSFLICELNIIMVPTS